MLCSKALRLCELWLQAAFDFEVFQVPLNCLVSCVLVKVIYNSVGFLMFKRPCVCACRNIFQGLEIRNISHAVRIVFRQLMQIQSNNVCGINRRETEVGAFGFDQLASAREYWGTETPPFPRARQARRS